MNLLMAQKRNVMPCTSKNMLFRTRGRNYGTYPVGYNVFVNAASQQSIDRRLARIEGQVRGLRRMVQSGEYCCDILTQLAATRSALDQAGAEIAVGHVKSCIVGHGTEDAHPHATPMSEEELMDELKVTLSRLMR